MLKVIKPGFLLVNFSLFIIGVCSGNLPSSIKPCSLSDPEFQKCVLHEAQNYLPAFCSGQPELGIPSADPMHIASLSMDNAGLQLTITNGTLTGSKKAQLTDVRIDLAKKRGVIEHFSDLKLTGKYKLDGKILILPVQGQGDFLMDIKNLHSKVKFSFNIVNGTDGKRYVKLGPHKIVYEVLGKAHFDFQNLFNGNKVLAETTLRFVNENWKIIINEIAPPAIHRVTAMQMEFIAIFFDKVPLDEMIIP